MPNRFIMKKAPNSDLREPLLSEENSEININEEKTPASSSLIRQQIFNAIITLDEKKTFSLIENLDEEKGVTVSNLIKDGNYVNAIALLNIQKDAYLGIKSSYVMQEGNRILIRDSRGQQTDKPISYHDWAIMAVNYVHAANKLLDVHGISDVFFSKDIKSILRDFLLEIKTSNDPEIALGIFINQKLLPEIMNYIAKIPNNKLTKQDVRKQLAEIRDFCNLEHPTTTVATRIQSGDKDLYQIDIPLVGNIPHKLKQEYEAIRDGKEQKILWYDKQKPHIKALIKQHAQDILDGKMIPTQLRKYLPGVRNGGEEFLVDMSSADKMIIQHHYHTGTPAHLLKTGSQRATNESIQQLKAATGAKHVLVLTLLSPWFTGTGNDARLVHQVERAVATANKKERETNFHTVNIPQNFMRGRVSFNQMSGATWLVDLAREERDQLPNGKEKDNLNKLITQYGGLQNGSQPYDPENENLKLVSVIQQLGHAINVAHEKRTGEVNFVAVVTSCQSGKDRAGLARIRTLVDSLKSYFGTDNHADALIKAGQVPAQAAFQGGTLGASGIKKDSIFALPKSWSHWKNILFKNTASYNKELPKDPGKAKSSRNKKIALAVVGLLVGGVLCATGIGAIAGAPLVAGAAVALAGIIGVIATNAIIGAGIFVGAVVMRKGIKDSLSAKKSAELSNRYNSLNIKRLHIEHAPSEIDDLRLSSQVSDHSPIRVSETDREVTDRVVETYESAFADLKAEHEDRLKTVNNAEAIENEKRLAYSYLNLYASTLELDTKRDDHLNKCIPYLRNKDYATQFLSDITSRNPFDIQALLSKIEKAYPLNVEKSDTEPHIEKIKAQLKKQLTIDSELKHEATSSNSNLRPR